ncbi:porin [Candidatus Pelagibacter sp.]|nr:porin [Candidatus Pelagibacter sp.]
MNNLKKIGLSALAGSLVATSVFAGEMNVTGDARIEVQHNKGSTLAANANKGKAFSMSNSIYFNGGSTLDNGLDVAVYFELDNGAEDGGPFDSHNLSVGNDSFGTLTFSGHGGSSAQSAVDDMATGDIWDNGFVKGATTAGIAGAPASSATNNMIGYSLPSLYDGLAINVSYVPSSATQNTSATDYHIAYSGYDGLVVGYAKGENTATTAAHADVDTMYATYVYGSLTAKIATTDNKSESTTAADDLKFSAWGLSYTLTDNISFGYASSTLETSDVASDLDQEVDGFTASYTTGGMTINAKMVNADNTAFLSTATADQEMWELGVSFAF